MFYNSDTYCNQKNDQMSCQDLEFFFLISVGFRCPREMEIYDTAIRYKYKVKLSQIIKIILAEG